GGGVTRRARAAEAPRFGGRRGGPPQDAAARARGTREPARGRGQASRRRRRGGSEGGRGAGARRGGAEKDVIGRHSRELDMASPRATAYTLSVRPRESGDPGGQGREFLGLHFGKPAQRHALRRDDG